MPSLFHFHVGRQCSENAVGTIDWAVLLHMVRIGRTVWIQTSIPPTQKNARTHPHSKDFASANL